MILAETFSPPVEIAAWLACAAFVVTMVNGVTKLIRNFKDKPAPGDVQREAAERFAEKEELRHHIEWNRREHENLFSKIGGVERGAAANTEKKFEERRIEHNADMRALRTDIGDIAKKVAGLETVTDLQNQHMASMDSKLDRLIERKA